MLGIGFSIGFAQSHFELGAIAALMLLAYGFLPIYRKLGLFTLSEYLGRRYDDRSRTLYSVILLVVALVQLTAAFYIGSRSLGLLLYGTVLEIGYVAGVVALALITGAYTIVGGLKAVIYTDVIQSVLLLLSGILIAVLTFAQPEVGGWAGMREHDLARSLADQKMHLYLPSGHPDLPWSGALTGLLILHCFYWSTNQTIVQRALAARSDWDARTGIVVAGFLKLTIPFFAIAGGVAAAQLFEMRMPERVIDPDAATPELIRLVVPMGFGLVGLVMAGLIGAILSSIDSLVNSASTLVTFDLYKKYVRPQATDAECLRVGKWVLAGLLSVSAVLALVTYDPAGAGNFFLRVSSQAGHFTPGLVVAFAFGMFWPGATARGSAVSISLAPVFFLRIRRAVFGAGGSQCRADGAVGDRAQLPAPGVRHGAVRGAHPLAGERPRSGCAECSRDGAPTIYGDGSRWVRAGPGGDGLSPGRPSGRGLPPSGILRLARSAAPGHRGCHCRDIGLVAVRALPEGALPGWHSPG